MIKSKPVNRPMVRIRYLLAIDTISIILAFALSLLIRYESFDVAVKLFWENWLLLLLGITVRIVINIQTGLYSRLWRFASVQDLLHIVESTLLASTILALVNYLVFPLFGLAHITSFSVLILDWFLNLAFLSASRLFLRIGLSWLTTHDKQLLGKLAPKRRVLIMGAGDIGSMVVRWMHDNPELGLQPVGFADDDPTKRSAKLLGVSVVGDRHDIPRLATELRLDEVIVAMPTAHETAISDVQEICEKAMVPARVIPSINDLLEGTLTLDQLRQWRPNGRHIQHTVQLPSEAATISNILVTGGAGFIGSNFVHYMLATYPDYRIVVYDKLTYAGNLDNLLGLKEKYGQRYAFLKGDICDTVQVAEAIEHNSIDAIVNFAAETHVDRSLMKPDSFLHTNVFGTYTLLEAAKRFDVMRYHQVSTDEVYGQVMRGSFDETDPLETRSPYSASKAAADLLVHAYHTSFDVQTTISRGSNNIGPYQYPEKVVPLFVTNAIDDQPIPLYGDGQYVRDYQYVLDHCRGIDLVFQYGIPGEIYNLGSEKEIKALDLAEMILDRLGKPHSLICFVEDRVGQDRRYSLNCSKIKQLGWRSEYPFERALDVTVDWYLENEWWWRKIKSGEYKEFYERQYKERLEQAVQHVLSE
jgi:dTDP-glucose 4,6-dehydratase